MTLFPDDTTRLAAEILEKCRKQKLIIATAESCTGGLVAACLTEIAGSSDVFDRGFVTYSNAAKHELLGVASMTLDKFGAVSRETALEMAAGALAHSRADIAIAITGIAGPGGGTAAKPVGLVHFAVAAKGGRTQTRSECYPDEGRQQIRLQAVRTALSLVLAAADRPEASPDPAGAPDRIRDAP